MIWSDRTLREHQACVIDGYNAAHVNPASYDLRLGNQLYRAHPVWGELTTYDLRNLCDGYPLPSHAQRQLSAEEFRLYVESDCAFDHIPLWGQVETFATTWLMPHEFVLCSSLEAVSIPLDAVALLFCKSSAGRNGLEHLHAGLGDPGFTGQWTWELHNVAPWPIRLIAGQRLMQHVIMTLDQRALIPYAVNGRYQGQQGPTPARQEMR